MAYQIGDIVRLRAVVADADGAEVDPTSLTVTIQQPDGTEYTKTYPPTVESGVYRDSVGTFRADFRTSQRGEHLVHWVSSGSGEGAELDRFYVVGDVFHA